MQGGHIARQVNPNACRKDLSVSYADQAEIAEHEYDVLGYMNLKCRCEFNLLHYHIYSSFNGKWNFEISDVHGTKLIWTIVQYKN